MRPFLKSLLTSRSAVIGFLLLILVLALAILGPLFYPQSPWDIAEQPFLPPFATLNDPLGTDTLGRNVASGLVHGAYVSLLIGFVSTLVSLAIGIPFGAAAGYFGGRIDDILMRITEFFQVIPTFAFAVVLVAIFQPTIWSIILAIAIVSWPPVARLLRGEVMALRRREFVEAAELSGQTPLRIILHQIMPNVLSPVIVMASMMVATAILTESALAFMGLGDPNIMSWGYMISVGRNVIQQAWWICFFPGVAIVITVLAFNMIGEGLNDIMNPRLRRQKAK